MPSAVAAVCIRGVMGCRADVRWHPPEDDAAAIFEDKSEALLLGHTAINRVCILKVICQCQLKRTKLGAWGAAGNDLANVVHHVLCCLAVTLLVVIAAVAVQGRDWCLVWTHTEFFDQYNSDDR